jgi:hypothetical protein
MIRTAAFLVLAMAAGHLMAQDARGIIERMQAEQIKRWEGVDTYFVQQVVMGHETVLLFERYEYIDDGGKPVPAFRMVTPDEIERRRAAGSGVGELSPDDLRVMADAYRMTGEGLAQGTEQGLADAGLPRGLFSAPGSDPWATTDMRVMMGGMADVLDDMADASEASAAEQETRPGNDLSAIAQRAVLVGTETVDGRKAFHLRIDDLDQVQTTEDGEEFAMRTVDWWIDAEAYVPLRMKIDGTATSRGETRPMTIEQHASDYRQVPGSRMYEPYRQLVRVAGALNAEQQKQMEEAQAQMAQLDAQLASMPESQRQMILGRMGPQMEMMRSMASGGGIEMVTEVREIQANPRTLPPPSVVTGMPGVPAAPVGAAAGRPAGPASSAGADSAAPRACLQEKIAAAQEAQPKKRGLGGLMGAVARTAGRIGDVVPGRNDRDASSQNPTFEDLSATARDLGVPQREIDACRNPG